MYSLKHLWVLFVAGNKNTVPFKKSIYTLALLEKRECRFEGENNKNRKIGFLFITVFSTHLILGSTNLRSISTSEWFFVKSSFFSLSNSSSLANLYTPIAPCTSPSLLYHAIIIAFFTNCWEKEGSKWRLPCLELLLKLKREIMRTYSFR